MNRALLALLSCLTATPALAQPFAEGNWMVRGRMAAIIPHEAGEVDPLGGEPYISTAIIPSLDISYFLTDSIAVEFIPGLIPHQVKIKDSSQGTRDGGWAYAVAPTLMLQYHREITPSFSPYIGLGMAYVAFFADDTVDQIEYEDDIAALVQLGANVQIEEDWFFNFDVKQSWVNTVADIGPGKATADVDINSTILGIGVGYRF